MIDGGGADGDEMVGGEFGDLLPAHAQLFAECRDVNVVAGAQIADDGAHFGFGRPGAQPPVEVVVERLLLGDGAAVKRAIAVVDLQTDMIVACDHRFEREPPQFAEPVRETRRHIDGERHVGLF